MLRSQYADISKMTKKPVAEWIGVQNSLSWYLQKPIAYPTYSERHTCRFRVTAFGWHLVHMPAGQGACSVQFGLILQLRFSRLTNFPLQTLSMWLIHRVPVIYSNTFTAHLTNYNMAYLSTPLRSLRIYEWNERNFIGGSCDFRYPSSKGSSGTQCRHFPEGPWRHLQ